MSARTIRDLKRIRGHDAAAAEGAGLKSLDTRFEGALAYRARLLVPARVRRGEGVHVETGRLRAILDSMVALTSASPPERAPCKARAANAHKGKPAQFEQVLSDNYTRRWLGTTITGVPAAGSQADLAADRQAMRQTLDNILQQMYLHRENNRPSKAHRDSVALHGILGVLHDFVEAHTLSKQNKQTM